MITKISRLENSLENPFDSRRINDPQGLIDDLVSQTTRQAQAIRALNLEVKSLKETIEKQNKKEKKLIGDLSDITPEKLEKES